MLTTEKTQETMVVYPEGKITAANADEFRQNLLELVQAGETNLTINLEKVDIIDSKGLAVFIICHKTLSEKGGDLTVVTENSDLRGLFHVMRLDEHFTICSSEES